MTVDAFPGDPARPKRRFGDGGGAAFTIKDLVLKHERQIDSLEEWRSEIRGVMTFIKVVLGTSVVSLIVSLLTIVALASGWKG